MEENEFDKKKAHQSRHSGRKADKKSAKTKHVQEGQTAKERNPKAFAFNSAVKAQRRFVRSQDIKSKKHHIPVIDRTPLEPPPVVVAVVGGPKVGKSTLLQCLIKNYTRQRLSSIMGPVTIVAGKKRRLTFIEVNNDVNSMIDIAKIADIVLMLIDATFGIEMETFEFLEICRAHGTPRIMGVLNHLDMFKDNKALKKKKRILKNRFQVELYPGAKLFYLSGLIHGEYLKNEIKNLGRFISVMKFRPLTWRSAHPYVLVDRIEDITNPEAIRTNPKCDRDAVLYGYVRGVPFQQNQRVHIPGCGDFQIKDINFLSDPCPLPSHQKKRSLNEKERLTYAPMSGVGGIVYDKDAVYIDLGGSHHARRRVKDEGSDSEDERNNGDDILQPLLDLQKTADEKRAQTQIQLFSNTKLLNNESDEDIDDDDDDDNDEYDTQQIKSEEGNKVEVGRKSLPEHEKVTDSTGIVRRRAIFHDNLDKDDDDAADEDDDDEEEEDDDVDDSEDDSQVEEEGEESDEDEESEEEESDEDNNLNDLEPPVKKKKMIASIKKSSSSSDDSDSEDYDLEGDLNRLKGENIDKSDCEVKSKLKISDNTEKEMIGLKNKDVEVTMKIQGLLDKLKTKPSINANVKSRTISGDSGISESEDDESESDDDNDDEDMQMTTNDNSFDNRDMASKDGETSEGSSSEDENEDSKLGYRSEMFKQATDNFYKNQSTVSYLRKYIYGEVAEEEDNGSDDDSEEVGGLFRSRNKTKQISPNSSHGLKEAVDTSRYNPTHLRNWADDELLDSIRDCFVTGEWKESENAATLLKMDAEDEDLYGDYEDLETGKKVDAEQKEEGEEEKEEKKEGVDESEAPTAADVKPVDKTSKEKRMEKKRRLKEMFDSEYDDKGDNEYFDSLKTEMSQQAQMNREEFEQLDDEQRVQYEGYRPGMYVRMEFSRMPCEFVTNFDASYPIVVGGLLDNEQKMGFIRVRIKVHRWYPKILKNKDPLILSLGWRRFQTLMYYAKREDDFKMRSLKYARKYLHIEGMFWGPITPISSGFVALQNITDRVADFRIAANGVILETDQSSKICKKLKFIGHPEKILKKTAFIKGMFNSETEIAKFEGAKVQTQSGIRGLIKKAKGKDGIFRATFEDVIKLSDVIIFKTWAPLTLTKYCTSVRTLLMPADEKAAWKGMRTVGEIKRERNIKNTPNPDSLYTKITKRREYVPLPLKIPKELQRALPYNEKPKITPKINKPQRVVVVKDPGEVKMDNFMKRLKTMMEDRQERDETHKLKQRTKYQADIADREHMRVVREKRKKAAACRYTSKKAGKKNKDV